MTTMTTILTEWMRCAFPRVFPIRRLLTDLSHSFKNEEEEEEDEDDDGASEADSEDEEAVELAQRQKLLNEEIRDLENAVAKKKAEVSKSGNPMIKVRRCSALRPGRSLEKGFCIDIHIFIETLRGRSQEASG